MEMGQIIRIIKNETSGIARFEFYTYTEKKYSASAPLNNTPDFEMYEKMSLEKFIERVSPYEVEEI